MVICDDVDGVRKNAFEDADDVVDDGTNAAAFVAIIIAITKASKTILEREVHFMFRG